MIKLKCVEYGFGWDDPYAYYRGYYEVNLNPDHVESVMKSGWKLHRSVKTRKTSKGWFGGIKSKEYHSARPYNHDKQLYVLKTVSGEVYRTYEKELLIKEGLLG